MPFAIIADLLLGTYRGAGADGRPERIPSVARLHSALLCAAGFGPRAVERDAGTLDIREADEEALRWLENNPPDSIRTPAVEVNTGGAIAYRDDGTVKKRPKSGGLTIKKLAKPPGAGTAVDGAFAWIWDKTPPGPVCAALEALCSDVAYLGTTESPVRLTAVTSDAIEATHHLGPDADLFTIGGTGSERPVSGRLEELADAHHAVTGKPPSAASDRYGTDEKSLSPVPPRMFTETAWYVPREEASEVDVPWPQVFTIPLDKPIPEQDRVGWAISAHQALVKAIGFGAPPVITGSYLPGTRRPANRIALHFLGAGMPLEERQNALAILVPKGVGSVDLDVLRTAVRDMKSLRGMRLRLATDGIRVLDGSRFWLPPQPGMIRLWRTVPAAVPDTRGSRDSEWNFAHAALLSLGFVWKEQLPRIHGRGAAYYGGLAAAVSETGAAVVHARAVRTADAGRYVHKVNEHAVVRPYDACLSLGSLAGPRTILAIGQSRHLGGGLLVPFDVPEGTRTDQLKLPGANGARA